MVTQHSPYYKEHLSLVVVGEEEESGNGVVGNLVVKGFAVKLEECGIGLDSVPTPAETVRIVSITQLQDQFIQHVVTIWTLS